MHLIDRLKSHFFNFHALFFCVCAVLGEVAFRFVTYRGFPIPPVSNTLFALFVGIIIYCIVSAFNGWKRRLAANIFLLGGAVLYFSQIVYYSIFNTYYTLFSMSNGGQVLEFMPVITETVLADILYLLMYLIPCAVYNIWISKQKQETIPVHKRLLCAGLTYTVLLAFFIPAAIRPNSGFGEFFGQQNYDKSIAAVGLAPTLNIDAIRTLFPPNEKMVFASEPEIAPTSEPSPSPTDAPETQPIDTPTPAPVYEKNVMDIDFAALIEGETDKRLISLHEYFAAQRPSSKNSHTGMFEGYNLIFITAEGFSPYAIDSELTPTLYMMANDGFKFTNFYNPIWGVSTSDGEYAACLGLIPKSGVWSFYKSAENYLPFAMGNQLNPLGYSSYAYHNNTFDYYRRDISHPNMGYDYKGVGNGLDMTTQWPRSDLEMMEISVDDYINNEPFNAYYMTVSGHLAYSFIGNSMSVKNRELTEHLPYSEACRAYLACQIELDRAMQYLLKRLEAAGVAGRTLIVLGADHYPYGLTNEQTSELAGHEITEGPELYKSPLIIYAAGMEGETVDRLSSSLDILPTISNLMGLEYDSRLLMGNDVFGGEEPLVLFNDRSCMTAYGYYSPQKGFTPNEGVELPDEYAKSISDIVKNKFQASAAILETDYYGKILKP